MISPEMIRRYSFFAGLSSENIVALAKCAKELSVSEGYSFFNEGEELTQFFLVVEGAVGIYIQIPDRDVPQLKSNHITGDLIMKDVLVSTIGTGNIFAWSALIPPHFTTAGAKTLTDCKVISFDFSQIAEEMEKDPQFGLLMVQKAAQVIRERLRDFRIESLAELVS